MYLKKLGAIGNGGVMLHLPIAWIRYYKLKPGDTVELIANGVLTISPVTRESNTDVDKD